MIFDALKYQWQLLRQAPPGQRFMQLYGRSRRQGRRGVGGLALMFAGVVLILLGAALLVLPGPGLPILVLGLALLAGQSLTAAQLTDRLELRLRALVQRVRGR